MMTDEERAELLSAATAWVVWWESSQPDHPATRLLRRVVDDPSDENLAEYATWLDQE